MSSTPAKDPAQAPNSGELSSICTVPCGLRLSGVPVHSINQWAPNPLTTHPSGAAAKKKNNKKKKNANKAKDVAQAGNDDSKRENDDGDDEEPESPTKTVSELEATWPPVCASALTTYLCVL